MSSIRPPALGPIVGHTTSNSCRLWIRAGDPSDAKSALSEDRRTIGVITVLDKGRPVPASSTRTAYFRLHREYDRTGTINLGREECIRPEGKPFALKPGTTYRVRMGTLALDDAFHNDAIVSDEDLARRIPPANVWAQELFDLPAEESEATFRTFERKSDGLSFLIGSCHYPGLFWKKKHSDRIFRPMIEEIGKDRSAGNPRFVLMVGDQIYADMFNKMIPIGLADTFEEYQDRYHDAFNSPNIRRLLRSVPQYMILDDHEIEDNWTQDSIANDRNKRVLFNLAIGAYMSYQWSHGPRNPEFDGRLYYKFDCSGFPFFVLDERTQRYKDDEPGLDDNHLLGRPSMYPKKEPTQLDHLCDWLAAHKQDPRPKFIVSPTVFVPNPVLTTKSDRHKEKSDAWPAFPATRRRLLSHIVKHNIQNVVFLSGDIHCSNVAEISFSGNSAVEKLKAFSVTSSAFYWPFWFADGEPSNYVHNSRRQNDSFPIDEAGKIIMDYKAYNFTQKDNFCRVDVDWKNRKMGVRAIDRKGRQIERATMKLA